jgi:para-aminobenzoate synthetase/4-amino-4-deoxychorismate lyase
VHAPAPGLPLAWFALHRSARAAAPPPVEWAEPPAPPDWRPRLGLAAYREVVARLHAHISAGDTYQVNFTFPLEAALAGEPGSWFAALAAAQRARHAAWLDTGRHVIASVSPELFFRRDGAMVELRPMKGTAARGATPALDDERAAALRASPKDRAENLMIVDMVRNDLGRVAELGSVETLSLFDVERYPTLLQMTSRVRGRTEAGLAELFAALFPSASVTGAPKRRTLEIIRDHEPGPRGVYTGAMGFAGPDRRACFNVAIRTLVADREARRVSFGVGSGIVADSEAAAEYAECLLKARVVSEAPFRLLETMAWRPGEGFALLREHLTRLEASGRHFGADPRLRAAAEAALDELARGLSVPTRVRLLADLNADIEVQAAPLAAEPTTPLRVALAADPVDPESAWLHHKTTRREAYETARRARPGFDDVLLWNHRGEVTESTVGNLVAEVGGERLTPPVSCGLLAGTFRARLLAENAVREAVIRLDELPGARLWLVNSVRGWREAVLEDTRPGGGPR